MNQKTEEKELRGHKLFNKLLRVVVLLLSVLTKQLLLYLYSFPLSCHFLYKFIVPTRSKNELFPFQHSTEQSSTAMLSKLTELTTTKIFKCFRENFPWLHWIKIFAYFRNFTSFWYSFHIHMLVQDKHLLFVGYFFRSLLSHSPCFILLRFSLQLNP